MGGGVGAGEGGGAGGGDGGGEAGNITEVVDRAAEKVEVPVATVASVGFGTAAVVKVAEAAAARAAAGKAVAGRVEAGLGWQEGWRR